MSEVNDEIIDKIISEYLSGKGSTTIEKELGVKKRKILKILNDRGVIRPHKRTNGEYDEFVFNGTHWCGTYTCDMCGNEIEVKASKQYYLNRNLKKKKTCKPCSLKKQVGEGNPFYGKKHSKESKQKISNKRIGIRTSDHMSKPEYKKMFSENQKKLWASGKMEHVREKMSKLMKERIKNGELKSYSRSKAEDEIINILEGLNITCEANYIIEGKIFDIYIPRFNLLIEYNGDYWHCNPNKYAPDYFHQKKGKYAKEMWEYDKNKLYLGKERGYNCEVIWETDYKKNNNVINELINKYE